MHPHVHDRLRPVVGHVAEAQQPGVVVRPSAPDMRAGRDPVLAAAVESAEGN